jgi:hypothetical protein
MVLNGRKVIQDVKKGKGTVGVKSTFPGENECQ